MRQVAWGSSFEPFVLFFVEFLVCVSRSMQYTVTIKVLTNAPPVTTLPTLQDGHTAQALARGPSGLFAILSASSSPSEHKPSTISKPADAVTPKGEHEQKKSAAAGGTENPRVTPAKRSHAGDAAVKSIAPGSSIPADDQSDKANSAKGAKENRKGFAASEAAAVRGDESQTLAASAGGITATSSVGSTGSNDGKGATEETRGVTAAGGAAEGGCHKGKDTETKAVRGGTRTTLTKAPGDASGGTEPTSTVAVVAVPVVPAGSAKPMQEESVASTASEAEEESVSESVSESDCSGMEARRSRGLARGKRRGRMRRNGGGGGSNAGASASGSASSRMRGGPSMKGRALKYGFGNGGVFTLKVRRRRGCEGRWKHTPTLFSRIVIGVRSSGMRRAVAMLCRDIVCQGLGLCEAFSLKRSTIIRIPLTGAKGSGRTGSYTRGY